METGRKLKLLIMLTLTVIFVAVMTATTVRAETMSETVRESIELAFPGAQVTEVEAETWNGQLVTEVELIAADGTQYEIYVSDEGEIVKQEEADGGIPWIGGELTIGLGVRMEEEIYRDTDTETSPVPFLRYENGPFEIQAYDDLSASYRLFGTADLGVAIKGVVNFEEGYDADDSDYFVGMDKLDTIYTLGFELQGMYGGWTAELDLAQDVSGEHDGQEVELTVGYPWDIGHLELRPQISAAWISEDAVDYFYGVSARESNPNRPTYSPGSTYAIGAEILMLYPIYRDLKLVALAEIETFGDEIKDSPLVDEDYEVEFILGLTYSF